jgi:plasmid stabilization system protein ParE
MKVYQVKPTRRALADADEAFTWLYKEAPEAALRWYDGLLDALKSLNQNPLRWGLARENPYFDDEIRQLLYGRYRVLFTVKGKTVFVLRVRHGARDTLMPDED